MKLLVTGSRKCAKSDYSIFEEWLNNLIIEKDLEITEVIHGGAKGADQFADRWAEARRIPIKVYRPNYKELGKRAPLVRNDVMVELCDICVAVFKFNQTGGTMYTAKGARAKNKLIGELKLDFKSVNDRLDIMIDLTQRMIDLLDKKS